LVAIYSIINLALVMGSESSLLSTQMVFSSTDVLQFGDMFRIFIEQHRLCSCTIQLHVRGLTDGQEQCWVNIPLVKFLVPDLQIEVQFCKSVG